jgi:capsular exopolysaccharide synthesis family protein
VLIDCVDTVRALLVSAARARSARVVMVVSAAEGEGKTSLVCHLAASMSRAGARALVVDGDLRNPTVHRLLDVPNDVGFSEVLRGQADVDSVIRPTGVPGLSLLPAGTCDPAALRALAQGCAAEVFARLREQYDFVVVDSSPLLAVADALLLGQNVDAVVFSLLREVSRIPRVDAARQRLAALGVPTLGAVVSGVHDEAGAQPYPYPYPSRKARDATGR